MIIIKAHDTALICMNGHSINSYYYDYSQFNTKFCKECGEINIFSCLHCNKEIRGSLRESFFLSSYDIPSYCTNCGRAYPWTDKKIESLKEAIMLSEISEDDKNEFKDNLPDIISETPRTRVAALKMKSIGTRMGKEIWSIVRDVFIDIASETAKKTMGIQ